MYYPFLRGKQFELILLRDIPDDFIEYVHPIIEPVKEDFKSLERTLKTLESKNALYTLVINPISGSKPVSQDLILTFIENNELNNSSLGYILNADSEEEELIRLLDRYEEKDFSIIHYGYSNSKILASKIKDFRNIKRHIFIDGYAGKLYQRYFKNNNIPLVLIRDGFKAQRKNSLYPENEHFSDLHITYKDEGMQGFGDFLTIGNDYSETGGPAYSVAIHLTYLNEEDDMFIYHFVSDRTDSPTDPGGKFLEALEKLISKGEEENTYIYTASKAYQEFFHLYEKQHYPGLGHVKKLSMQHHLELIVHYFRK